MYNYILFREKMIRSKVPSLEHVSLIKIAVSLWNQDDIRALLINFKHESITKRVKWQEIENEVLEKVSRLPQPNRLNDKVSGLIKPIGLQILDWIEYHNNSYLDVNLPSELFWTWQGTIDEKKTAEALIKDDNLDILTRYKLACIYCLEDDILKSWKRIPRKNKQLFYSSKGPEDVKQEQLVVFWTYSIMGEVAKWKNMFERERDQLAYRTLYEDVFECAVLTRHKLAAAYFLHKLNPVEREESLVRITVSLIAKRFIYDDGAIPYYKKKISDILYFLLSQMNEEQQSELFQGCSYEVLSCLLDWPLQDLFMETAKRMWNFLREDRFCQLLYDIVKVKLEFKDYCYNKLFEEFWVQAPIHFRKHVLHSRSIGRLLLSLLEADDKENVELILNDASTKEKEMIIFSCTERVIFENLIHRGKCDLVMFLVQKCISSKDALIKLKRKFRKVLFPAEENYFQLRESDMVISNLSEIHIPLSVKTPRENDKSSRFFEMLDELIQSYD